MEDDVIRSGRTWTEVKKMAWDSERWKEFVIPWARVMEAMRMREDLIIPFVVKRPQLKIELFNKTIPRP